MVTCRFDAVAAALCHRAEAVPPTLRLRLQRPLPQNVTALCRKERWRPPHRPQVRLIDGKCQIECRDGFAFRPDL